MRKLTGIGTEKPPANRPRYPWVGVESDGQGGEVGRTPLWSQSPANPGAVGIDHVSLRLVLYRPVIRVDDE